MNTNPEKTNWDVLIVGTGVGGATLGHALAKAGRRVLFLEKGLSNLSGAPAHRGDWAEELCRGKIISPAKREQSLNEASRCSDEFEDLSDTRPLRFVPVIGNGTGGSSALYGMASERLFPVDFVPRQNHLGAAETTLPESWPISYGDLRPYYEAAERLYRVRGTADPLRDQAEAEHLLPPPSLTAANAEMSDFLQGRGLNPYRLHMACEYKPNCSICQGYLCPQTCKNDAGHICLEPAIRVHGAELLTSCRVVNLEANRTSVERVVCDWQGRRMSLRGKIVVLAAGALASPTLLLHSDASAWPHGLGNRHDVVGRNLMRHTGELFIIKVNSPVTALEKQLAFNDLYWANGWKLGTVQSFGAPPPLGYFVYQPQWRARLARIAAINYIGWRLWRSYFSRRIVIAQIMEDLPYADNRVLPGTQSESKSPIRIRYRVRDYERQRLKLFVEQFSQLLRPYRFRRSNDANNNRNLAHACGTCRFGDDPRTSVLDATNRVHDVANLYVVDSSFFPSSGGINPSLTIAANALRVADHINNLL